MTDPTTPPAADVAVKAKPVLALITHAFGAFATKAEKLAFTMAVKTCCRDLNISINQPKPTEQP